MNDLRAALPKQVEQATCCKKCKNKLHHRVHRGFLIKMLFPNAPIRRYICTNCLKKQYVYIK